MEKNSEYVVWSEFGVSGLYIPVLSPVDMQYGRMKIKIKKVFQTF